MCVLSLWYLLFGVCVVGMCDITCLVKVWRVGVFGMCVVCVWAICVVCV